MDEKDKKIQELTDLTATQAAQIVTLTSERDTTVTDKEGLAKTVTEKDAIIEQKNKDIIGTRQQYKKMSERTKEEIEAMTEAEVEALKRSETQEKELADLKKDTADRNKKEFDARKNTLIAKFAGKNPDIAKKIEENLGKLNPALLEKAVTEQDLAPLVEMAYNSLGVVRPDAIKGALGAGPGESVGEGDKKDFADTPEGQDMLSRLAPAAVEKK